MFNLCGKTALVTGSMQGIGYAIAKCFAEHGAKVYVHGVSSIEKCKKASAEIENSIPVLADLSQSECADKLYEQTGDVDILVLNASAQVYGGIDEITDEDFDKQFDTNVKSTIKLVQKYLPHMKENKHGRIVTIGSVNQYNQHPRLMVYAATKTAQMKLVKSMAKVLASDGITVNNIAPGVVLTPRNEEVLKDKEYYDNVLRNIPCGFAGKPEDIAPAVLMLCSDEGRYITGTDIIIDGGMHL